MMNHSKKLEALVATRKDAAYDGADSTCTAGYDNDGSTGFEIFENGFEFAMTCAKNGLEAWYCYGEDGLIVFFFAAKSEEEVVEKVRLWPEDEAEESEEEESED